MRGATIKPQVPASFFPLPKAAEPEIQQQPNTSRRRTETTHPAPKPSTTSDDFGDDGIDDEALVTASFSDLDFDHIDKYRDPAAVITRKNTVKNKSAGKPANSVTKSANSANYDQEPVQLLNGKWACSHKCKDKTACKHLCCKEGMDKPSRKTVDTKGKSKDIDQPQGSQSPASTQPRKEVQTKLQVTSSKRKTSANIEELDLTQQEKKSKPAPVSQRPKEYRELQQLHRSTQGQKDLPRKIHTVMSTKPAYCYSQGGEHNLSFMIQGNQDIQAASSDYGDVQFDEASSHVNHLMASCEERLPESVTQYFEDEVDDVDPVQPANHGSETFGDDDSVLGAAMVGIADSQWLIKDELCGEGKSARVLEDFELDFDANDAIGDYSEDINQSFPALQREATGRHENGDKDMTQTPRHAQKQKKPGPFVLNTSSLGTQGYDSTLVSHAGNTVTDDQLKRPHIKVGLLAESVDEFDPEDEENMQQVLDMLDVEPAVPERAMPDAFKDLDPWVFQEYGDVVELLDD